MAEAKTKVRTAITLELSEVEAQVLAVLVDRVIGDIEVSYRRETDEIGEALFSAGVRVNSAIEKKIGDADRAVRFLDGRPFEVS